MSACSLLLSTCIALADQAPQPVDGSELTGNPADDDSKGGNPPQAGAEFTQTSGDTADRLAKIAAEKEQLETRLQRLKESANATKGEVATLQTRLDEVDAEKAAMRLQLDLLNRKQADLEAEAAQVAPLKRRLSDSQSAADRAAAAADALRAEIEQLKQQRQGEAQKHTAQLTAAELRLREHKDRATNLDAQIQRLEQQLAQREAQVERLQAAEARRAEAKQQLESRLEELRARLPAPEGGTVTANDARAQARSEAETLERLIREGQGVNNPQLWQQIREAENALHRNQYLLARAEGNRTVYRVRPGDSLARISALVYGTDKGWQEIFEANRHLLDDPDRVMPGLTLVIP
ncbi:LysM peptidoglycan-binding domain-containing protein [Halochromatium sp.]